MNTWLHMYDIIKLPFESLCFSCETRDLVFSSFDFMNEATTNAFSKSNQFSINIQNVSVKKRQFDQLLNVFPRNCDCVLYIQK